VLVAERGHPVRASASRERDLSERVVSALRRWRTGCLMRSRTKTRPTQLNRPRFFPLVLYLISTTITTAGQSLQACGLLIDPARLPLASSSLPSAAPAFSLFDRPGNSVPPKEPPSLRCEMPPPKHLATVVSEPDPDCFLPFCFCRSEHQQRLCQHRDSDMPQANFLGFPPRFGQGVQGLAWKINESGGRREKNL